MQYVFGIVVILIGLKLIFFDGQAAKHAVEFQNKTFGYKFGKSEVRNTRIGSVIVGVIFVMLGVASLVGFGGFQLH